MALELVNNLPYDHPYRWDGTAVGGQKLWRPDELGASLALWLDAEDTASITLNGSTVSQWDDKSGNDRHVSQATAAAQPSYQTTGLNGKPALAWGAVANSKFLKATAVTNYSPKRFFGVADYDGSDPFSNFVTVFSHDVVVSQDFLRSNNTGTSWVNVNPVFQNGSSASTLVALPEISNPFVFSTDYEQTANRPNIWIGSDRAITDRSWKGNISEVIALSVVPTAEIKQQIEGYLAWKWGLTANLPVSHPYKTTPPTA